MDHHYVNDRMCINAGQYRQLCYWLHSGAVVVPGILLMLSIDNGYHSVEKLITLHTFVGRIVEKHNA